MKTTSYGCLPCCSCVRSILYCNFLFLINRVCFQTLPYSIYVMPFTFDFSSFSFAAIPLILIKHSDCFFSSLVFSLVTIKIFIDQKKIYERSLDLQIITSLSFSDSKYPHFIMPSSTSFQITSDISLIYWFILCSFLENKLFKRNLP